MHDDDEYDASRYDSAAGWEPDRLKINAEARRRQRELDAIDAGFNPFELAAGSRATAGHSPKPPARLFGSLWHEGELAILAGPAGSGKSVLAVQLADRIARGRRAADALVGTGRSKPQKVLYVDFERTNAQFTERYSAPHPLPGKLPVRHRFPAGFTRVTLGDLHYIPARFKGDAHQFLSYWLDDTIETARAPVVIIDNLSYLTRSLTGAASAGRLMKTLKLWANRYQISILAITHTKKLPSWTGGVPEGRGGRNSKSALSLKHLTAASPVADLADSVFAIAPSTLGPDIRYIKHLKSRNAPIEHDASQVIACQIARDETMPASPNSSFEIRNSPFLHLSFLGLTPESIHLTDPFTRLSTPQPKQLPAPKGVVNMLISREYRKYLER